MVDGDTLRWRTYDEYFRILEDRGIPLNVIRNVDLVHVRRVVLGEGDI